eukprot:sb/3461494/
MTMYRAPHVLILCRSAVYIPLAYIYPPYIYPPYIVFILKRSTLPLHAYVAVRQYHPEKPTTGGVTEDLPVHMVNPTPLPPTTTPKHIDDQLPPVQDEVLEAVEVKEETKIEEVKPEEVSAATAPTTQQIEEVAIPKSVTPTTTQSGVLVRFWNTTKVHAIHYWDGMKLLAFEVRVSARLSKKIFRGEALTRRERHQLKRTVGDLFRLVPFAVFVIIPFMEILLPVAIYFFPGMMPSTFETIDKKKEKKLKKLKLKLDLAKFMQESMVSGITLQNGQPYQLDKFSEFIARQDNTVEPRFSDPRFILSLNRGATKSGPDSTVGPRFTGWVNFPRYRKFTVFDPIYRAPRFTGQDPFPGYPGKSGSDCISVPLPIITRSKDPRDDIDELVSFSKLFSEGLTLDNLPSSYIVALCQLLNLDTGFHTDAFLRFRLRSRMRTLKEDDMVIRSEGLHLMSAAELQQANVDRGMRSVGVSLERLTNQLDQIGEAKISLAARAGEKLDNKARLDAVVKQEELIQKEQAQQIEKEIRYTEAARKLEEVKAKESSNTRVAANLQMRKETLKDMAKPILTEDQLEFRRQEVAEIQRVITQLRDKKNPLLEEKGELRDLIEKALIYHMTVEKGAFKASTGNMLLANKIAKMLNHSHKVLAELEKSLSDLSEQNINTSVSEDDVVLTKGEVKNAIKEILDLDKKEKLLAILEVLSESHDQTIKTSEILKNIVIWNRKDNVKLFNSMREILGNVFCGSRPSWFCFVFSNGCVIQKNAIFCGCFCDNSILAVYSLYQPRAEGLVPTIQLQAVAEIQRVITQLRDKKNPLLEEKGELRDLIEKALIYHMTVEKGAFKASTGNMLLANKIAKMLNHSHKVLAELEKSLSDLSEQNINTSVSEDDVVLTKGEVKNAIKEILDLDKKEKLLAILEVLSESHDQTIKTSEILKVLDGNIRERCGSRPSWFCFVFSNGCVIQKNAIFCGCFCDISILAMYSLYQIFHLKLRPRRPDLSLPNQNGIGAARRFSLCHTGPQRTIAVWRFYTFIHAERDGILSVFLCTPLLEHSLV